MILGLLLYKNILQKPIHMVYAALDLPLSSWLPVLPRVQHACHQHLSSEATTIVVTEWTILGPNESIFSKGAL